MYNDSMKVFVTGGCGYIGSHVVKQSILEGHDVYVFDNLERGFKEPLDRIQKLTKKSVHFVQGDIRDKDQIYSALKNAMPDVVFHLAAYKSVGEGESKPEMYIKNNFEGSKNLVESMIDLGIPRIFFSSTSSVYGNNPETPFTEESPTNPISVYGKTKLMLEEFVDQQCKLGKIKAIAFRYFNVIGADETGEIGEDPKFSSNLLAVIGRVLTKQQEYLQLFGNKFNTRDGSQERDYIHVNDIASAHLKGLDFDLNDYLEIFNLSTGKSTSCLEIIKAVEEVTGLKVNYVVTDPRPGDPEISYASSQKANTLLKWNAERDLHTSIKTYWNWTNKYPRGYSY